MIQQALDRSFDRGALRHQAERFSRANFLTSFTRAVREAIEDKAVSGDADAARWGAHPPARFPDEWPPSPEQPGKRLP